MKRARKEVFDHLRENGYKVSCHTEIIGFLMGVGILTPKQDHISIRAKDNGGDLYDFIEWYNNPQEEKKNEEKVDTITVKVKDIYPIMDTLVDLQGDALDEWDVPRYASLTRLIDSLCDIFHLNEEE